MIEGPFQLALKYYGLYEPEEVYKKMCPFHGDINASLQINSDKNYFYCHGCGASGGAAELVQNFNKNQSPLECLFELSQITKGRVATVREVKEETKKSTILPAKDYYFNLPKTNWFKLCDTDDIETKAYLKMRGFRTKFLNECGCRANFNNAYPLIFPIYENKMFKGWVCRTTDPEVEEHRKYLYNKGFRKKNTLGGTITKGEPLLIVEGYIDMLMAKQSGIKNVVCLFGWKATPRQIEKIRKREIPIIVLGLDKDKCGVKGNALLKREFKNTVELNYRNDKDFGDVVKNGNSLKILKQFERLVKTA